MNSNEWEEVKLSEVCEIIGGGTPKTSISEYWNGDIPWLSVVDFNSDNRHVFTTEKTITESGLNNSSTKILNKGDIIISARGTVGALAQLAIPMAFNQSCYGIRANNKTINDFLYYAIKNILKEIKANTHGSVFDTITRNTFEILTILLPSLPEQKAIAATLSCLDDMIELNNRTNQILEEIAQSIYKRWFVDFEFPNEEGEPYKSSGGEMIDSELGEIPKGWRVVELGDVTTNIRERTKSNDYKVLSTVNTGDLKLSEEYFTKQVFSKDLSKYIIVRIKEFAYNPARVNIGSIGMNEYDFDGCVSPVYVVFKSEEDFHWFFKMFIKTKNFKSEVVKRASGSVRQSMNYSDFALIKIVYPPKGVIVKFNQFFETCYLAQREFTKEMEILSDIRDTLLPKLMSGEIRVPVEEVV